jgi:MoxR-like ATPase
MIAKLRQLVGQLRKESDSVRADELEGRIKGARQDALRTLRDRLDLYEDGERVVRLGKHRFSVNDQPFELTIVPRDEGDQTFLCLHLTGTDFIEVIADPELEATRRYWSQTLASETSDVYRAEYLASSILFDAEEGKNGLSLQLLTEKSHDDAALVELVRGYAQPRYDEGYERGVHDVDAARILAQILTLRASAGLLRFPPRSRAIACAYFGFGIEARAKETLSRRAMSLGRLRSQALDSQGLSTLAAELGPPLLTFAHELGIECDAREAHTAARYLVEELSSPQPRFVTSAAAFTLRDELLAHLDRNHARRAFEDDLRALEMHPKARLDLASAWVMAVARQYPELKHAELETSVLFLTERLIDRETSHALVTFEIKELLGSHPRIQNRTLVIRLDEFLDRLQSFHAHEVPGFRSYRELRHRILEREKKRLRIEELRPKPMSSFVRNQLIDQVYLPMIGDNLAKQIGAVGEQKRTDNMGLLLLISPPGYGKTTLMEYVANRLGLVFVKINGPSIGHAVTSLDPALVKSATAQKEVEKINFALEMGNNVMLYLDDIQHTNPELLQQFISMCDAQRRMEGIWRGRSRTYDLRGKKFCVVMAGNPYTETGEKFRIPDMLANRADTYNLGEVLAGRAEAFALSYIENALTSNPVLAPLTTRPPQDIAKILRMAAGDDVGASELSHGYGAAELSEIVTVLARLFRIRDVLLKVNAEYIRSASQEDAYRTEPPFKLQGSYRNMTKMTAKVVAAMNDEELERLIDDHYRGEAQTLTTGAEQNLLKLAELRGRLDAASSARWQEIQREYRRRKTMGGADDDPVTRMTGTLSTLGDGLEQIKLALSSASERAHTEASDRALDVRHLLATLAQKLEHVSRPEVAVTVDAPAGYTELLAQQIRITEQTLLPLVQGAARNLEDSRSLQQHMVQLLELLRRIDVGMRSQEEPAAK